MPQEFVLTLKTEKQGGFFWPLVRSTFAWVGFGVTVAVGASILDAPTPQVQPALMIEAFGEGWQAYEAAYYAKTSSYGEAPLDPVEAGPVVNPCDAIAPDWLLGDSKLFVNPFRDAPVLPGQSLPNQELSDVH